MEKIQREDIVRKDAKLCWNAMGHLGSSFKGSQVKQPHRGSMLQRLLLLAVVLVLELGGRPAQAGLPYASQYQAPNYHYNFNPQLDRWFPSRDAACRDVFNDFVARFESYQPGLLTYRYLGPQNTGLWYGHNVGECRYTGTNPWFGEVLHRDGLIARATTQCPANSTWINSACECDPGFQEDAATGLCRPAKPMCSRTDGQSAGNPILPATGEKYRSEPDWAGSGADAIDLVRTYRSTWAVDKSRGADSLGMAWDHNHRVRLSAAPHDAPTSVAVTFGDGSLMAFAKDVAMGTWRATNGADTLVTDASGWLLQNAGDGSALRFSTAGLLLSKTARNGWVTTYSYNSAGRLASVTNAFGRSLVFAYGGYGNDRLVSVTTPDGKVIGYTYDSAGRLASVVYPDGKSRQFLYENTAFPHALTAIVDENAQRWGSFAYDAQGRAVSTELAGGAERYQVSYPAAGQASVQDPLGTSRTYSYGTRLGQLAVEGSNMPSGAGAADAASRVQNAQGLIASQTDFLGRSTTYQWDSARRLPLSTTEAAGTPQQRTTATEWHPQWRLPTKITETGRETRYTYDSAGNRLSEAVTDTTASPAQTRTRSWTYHPSGLVATATEFNGATTSYQYDSAGNLTQATNALGQSTTYTHDAAGRVLTETEPTGVVNTYQYDLRGRLLSHSRAGLASTYTYRPSGQVASATLPGGHAITYTYDAAQRLTGWSDNRGTSGSYQLDAMGNRVNESVKDAQGATAWQIARGINSLNRVASTTVGGSQATSYGYDANGDATSQSQNVGGMAQTTTWGLDALRRVQSITQADNATATLQYNALDAVTQASDFRSVATTYGRDAQGNATQETTPDAGSRSATYDAQGRLATTTDAVGRSTQVTRDALGRPTQIQSNAPGGATLASTLHYDLAGADYNASGAPQASVGHLSEAIDPGATTRWQRDALGRVTRKTQTLAGGDTRSVATTYVPAGQGGAGGVQTITYPSGQQLTHQYDATGRIMALHWGGQPLLTGITWNPLDQPTGWQWSGFAQAPGSANLLSEQRSYTTAGQLASTGLLELDWDSAGRVAQIWQEHMLPGASGTAPQQALITSVHTYDSVGRLTASAHSAAPGLVLPTGWSLADTLGPTSMGYAWDRNGNRTQASYSAGTAAGTSTLQRVYQVASGSNRLQGYSETVSIPGSPSQNRSTSYQHDATGALTQKGGNYLHHGADGRLARTSASADPAHPQAVAYTYNTQGQRLLKSDARSVGANQAPATQHTVYADDGIGSTVLGQYANRRSSTSAAPQNEADSTEIIYLPTASGPLPVAAQINGRLYAIDADHLNTPRRLTDRQGQVAWQWLITGFGETPPTTGAEGYAQPGATGLQSYAEPVPFELRYPGQQWDAETNLAYNLHRYYDAQTGRYIQADPIGLEGGWNRFGYVE
ncbi:MAG: RHS repeat protein, partial [Burkholderiaceae bacterium]